MRAWLNGYNGTDYKITDYTNKGFYNLAFKDNEKGAIITTEVDNSASTTYSSYNQYACENTFDKISLCITITSPTNNPTNSSHNQSPIIRTQVRVLALPLPVLLF